MATAQEFDAQNTIAERSVDNLTFAEEVKADRLKVLYKVTVQAVIVVIALILTFGSLATNVELSWIVALGIIVVGAGSTGFLLNRFGYQVAAWTYTLSTMLGIGMMMGTADSTAMQIIPFVFPIIIFLGGLLLSPVSAFMLSGVAAGIIFAVPRFTEGVWFVEPYHQAAASFFAVLSAALAAQVTGELYQITQWALDNYRRERTTNDELFEKRNEVRKSLARAEALGDQLRSTNDELEIAHREAEEAKHFRGQFLANMSHELRTPLNAIIGFSETMLQFPIMYDNEELPPAYQRDLNQIYNSGRQLLHVINDILDLAKVDAGKLEIHLGKVETGAIANAVMATAKGLLGSKPVTLSQDIPETMPLAWADETRLRQVLLNLYSNACKYTDEGSITLHCTVDDDAGMIQFSVADTGLGIDPEYHDQLFAEFQQAKHGGRDPRSGSGLGLAISKQLLELMGGSIWMESTVGEGSTFYFTVPLYDGQDETTTLAERVVTVTAASSPAQGDI